MAIIDVSWPVSPRMAVWPGSAPPSIEHLHERARGARANVTRWTVDAHHGTHVDAPRHFDDDGVGVDGIPLDHLVGPCSLVDVSDLPGPEISWAQLQERADRLEPRVLLKTRSSHRQSEEGPFSSELVTLALDAAQGLVAAGVHTVGVDALSVDQYASQARPVHELLFAAGVTIVEGLRLGHASAGAYLLCCLPILLSGSDGAPARAVLLPL